MARRQTEHGSDLGAPCVVERTFGWLHHFQRLLGRATTDAPRSMKPSSHSAADEAGSRTDRWQKAGVAPRINECCFRWYGRDRDKTAVSRPCLVLIGGFVCPDSCC